jgi:3-oxoacyl-[acyl-carrier protein] reductase
MREQTPLRKLGQPEDIANLVTFLASERSGHITGQVIIIDGGRIIQR